MSKKLWLALVLTSMIAGCHDDSDKAGVIVDLSPDSADIKEGHSGFFFMSFSQQPSADIVLSFESSAPDVVRVVNQSVTITPQDWASCVFEVECIYNSTYSGDSLNFITVTASSSDLLYHNYQYDLYHIQVF